MVYVHTHQATSKGSGFGPCFALRNSLISLHGTVAGNIPQRFLVRTDMTCESPTPHPKGALLDSELVAVKAI